MITMEFKGLSVLEQRLKEFPVIVQKRLLRRSVLAGAGVVRSAARERVRKKSGALAKSIKARRKQHRGKIVAGEIYVVGPTVPYGHLVELGSAPHVIKPVKAKALGYKGRFGKKVMHPGTAPYPFLRPALYENRVKVVQKMAKALKAGIEREAMQELARRFREPA